MSDAAVQTGETLKIGFGSAAYTGFILEAYEVESDGDEELIVDENGAMATVITFDPKKRYRLEMILKAAASLEPPAKNSTITITNSGGDSVAARCESFRVAHSKGATRASVTLVKESSMTYT